MRSDESVLVDDSDDEDGVFACWPSDAEMVLARFATVAELGPRVLRVASFDRSLERLCLTKLGAVAALGRAGAAMVSFLLAALCSSIILRLAAASASVSLADRCMIGASVGGEDRGSLISALEAEFEALMLDTLTAACGPMILTACAFGVSSSSTCASVLGLGTLSSAGLIGPASLTRWSYLSKKGERGVVSAGDAEEDDNPELIVEAGSCIVKRGGFAVSAVSHEWSASCSKSSFSPQSAHLALGSSGSSTVARMMVYEASLDTSPSVAEAGDGGRCRESTCVACEYSS